MVPGTINIVVLGSDHRPDWKDWHTDVVQIVSIQPLVPAVTVLSIPRDLYVYVPEFGMSRVNFADMYGELYGFDYQADADHCLDVCLGLVLIPGFDPAVAGDAR